MGRRHERDRNHPSSPIADPEHICTRGPGYFYRSCAAFQSCQLAAREVVALASVFQYKAILDMKFRIGIVAKSPVFWIAFFLVAIALLTGLGPEEKSLGKNIRVVYLHGAWVWTSLAVLVASGAVGSAALLTHRPDLHSWSEALGRTGLLFWVSYLPISIWAMQTSWNGLFLAEPRWRLAMIFAIAGLLLQVGLTLIDRPAWTSAANIVFVLVLLLSLAGTGEVMHPRSPILSSDSRLIQLYFAVLVAAAFLAALQVARLWRRRIPSSTCINTCKDSN